MEKTYYPINEDSARSAHELMSFSDYKQGSKTAEYQGYVDKAYEIADKAAKARPDEAAHIYTLADRYARKMADNMNAESRIGCRCPSIMISGGSNFPVEKKKKQVAALDRNRQEWNEIQKILEKIRSIERGKDIIQADDENALEKLEKKLENLQRDQAFMKAVNAYYRKNGNIYGCNELTEEQTKQIEASMAKDWHYEKKPFLSWQLSNNNKNIHAVEARIAQLKAEKERQTTQKDYDGFRVVEETDLMRLQIFFDGKPNTEIRDILKKNGFRWAPSQGAWQRQLTPNARSVFKHYVLPELEQLAKEGIA